MSVDINSVIQVEGIDPSVSVGEVRTVFTKFGTIEVVVWDGPLLYILFYRPGSAEKAEISPVEFDGTMLAVSRVPLAAVPHVQNLLLEVKEADAERRVSKMLSEMTVEKRHSFLSRFHPEKEDDKGQLRRQLKHEFSDETPPTGDIRETVSSKPAEKLVAFHANRLSNFSGEASKTEVPYKQWRSEVIGTMDEKTTSSAQVLQLIRCSLRGVAAEVVVNMEGDVTPRSIISKMDMIFGEVLTPRVVLGKFYTAEQGETEGVAMWSCRLEEIRSHAPGSISEEELKNQFWQGIRNDKLKLGLRSVLEEFTYTELVIEARKLELDLKLAPSKAEKATEKSTEKSKAKVAQIAASSETDIQTQLKSLIDRFDAMETKLSESQSTDIPRGRGNFRRGSRRGGYQGQGTRPSSQNRRRTCYACGDVGHISTECKKSNKSNRASNSTASGSGTGARSETS